MNVDRKFHGQILFKITRLKPLLECGYWYTMSFKIYIHKRILQSIVLVICNLLSLCSQALYMALHFLTCWFHFSIFPLLYGINPMYLIERTPTVYIYLFVADIESRTQYRVPKLSDLLECFLKLCQNWAPKFCFWRFWKCPIRCN